MADNSFMGNIVYYIFYVVWYFGCFNVSAILYADFLDQAKLRKACLLGVKTELSHTYTLDYSDINFDQ